LDWLKTKISDPLFVVQDRHIQEDLELDGKWKDIKRRTRPIFTLDEDGKKGMNRRACTAEDKIKPVTRKVRQVYVGLS
jgi:hypothetical protein